MDFVALLASALAATGRVLTVDVNPGCPTSEGFVCGGVANSSFLPGLLQVNTEDGFFVSTPAELQALAAADGGAGALGGRWAAGFEPGNVGEAAFKAMVGWLGSGAACGDVGCPQALASWAVHEWNVGPQPDWLLDTITTFLDG